MHNGAFNGYVMLAYILHIHKYRWIIKFNENEMKKKP